MFKRVCGRQTAFWGATRVCAKRDSFVINRIYCGRANKAYRLAQSPLANPFVVGKDGDRKQVIAKYRVWLWERINQPNSPQLRELKRIIALSREMGEGGWIELSCWCGKEESCHVDIVIRCLNWMSNLYL